MKPSKRAWIEPVIDHKKKAVTFQVKTGVGAMSEASKVGRGAKFRCLVCGQIAADQCIKDAGTAGEMESQMMAIVVEGPRGRIYLPPESEHEQIALSTEPPWVPGEVLPIEPRAIWCTLYGLTTHADLYTKRQLVALATFSDLLSTARQRVIDDGGDSKYADAIVTYLALAVDKSADFWSSLATWSAQAKNELVVSTFRRQGLPMTWDFGEVNPFSSSGGNFESNVAFAARALEYTPARGLGYARQLDATSGIQKTVMFSTDPPYYDNIGYADLSDFFYVWLRRGLSPIYPDLFSTLLTPKRQELIASPYRFDGNKERAQEFFQDGFGKSFAEMRRAQHPDYPLTVFYAFKQAEEDDGPASDTSGNLASTGWETMLEGMLRAGFQVKGTWPMRSERAGRSTALGTNALASSIVLVCRPLAENAPITTRKDFLSALKKELPRALRNLQKGNIAPVDLAQAAIGPGMAVFSRYTKVLETDGTPMRVRTALALINQGLDEVLSELESEFDPDTRWALAWFEQHQFDEGLYGDAEVLATAKALSISRLAETGILHSRAGKVRLLRREELPEAWDPSSDARLTVWEVTQHLIRSLDQKGEMETANLKAKIGGMAEIARDLAYRLYTLCERKGWAEEASYYNSLVVAWPSMASEAFQLS
jgi:putative DNA methylase